MGAVPIELEPFENVVQGVQWVRSSIVMGKEFSNPV
jgi:hypothetical protein